MKKFRNKITGEELSWLEFSSLVITETGRQFEDHHDELWCNLDVGEQVELYHEQWKHQLETDWMEIE